MKKILAIAATAAAMMATPAAAQSRVEARVGMDWANGNEEAVAGVALGHDFTTDGTTLFGIEASGDKLLVDGSDVEYGLTGRIGTRTGGGTGKLYALGGHTFREGTDNWHAGLGYELNVAPTTYVKAEYRRAFYENASDGNRATVGLGFRF